MTTKGVGNDRSQHLKMFGEVSKPPSAEMNEIWPISASDINRDASDVGCQLVMSRISLELRPV